MRSRGFTIAVAAVTFVVLGVMVAMAAGTPEIDNANVTFQLKASGLKTVSCAGEDGTSYNKVTGKWSGGEADFSPGSTDYSLTGTLTLSGAVWTINQTTLRGVFQAAAALSSSGVTIYKGSITLITQRISGTQTIQARGWIVAKTYTNASPDGGSVLANVDAMLTVGTLPMTGLFGDAPAQLGYPNYSVTTINQTC
jgi:hypothetical protein